MITSGPLQPALLASAATPAIYPAVDHDGRRLYDGGVVANVPMRQALAMGARSLVVLDPTFPGHLPPPPQTAADAVFYTVFVTMRTQAVLDAPIAAADAPVLTCRAHRCTASHRSTSGTPGRSPKRHTRPPTSSLRK